MANYNRGGSMGMGSIPPVIKNLLIINGLVWLAQIVFGKQGIFLEEYGALWSIGSGNFRIWQLVSYMFMHQALDAQGGIVFAHILFNMFALWMFGTILENVWGAKRFFTFYMICGIFAGITQLVMQSGFDYAVGASGAIMGVMAGFVYLFPNTPLYIMFIPIPIKAKYVIPGFMLLDLFGSFAPQQGDNVAHWAHLGGALAGLILVIYWNRKNRRNFY
jgi:membrane associated rhomboid family serine protease